MEISAGYCRGEPVRVADEARFRRIVAAFEARVIEDTDAEGTKRFGFVSEEDCGSVPRIDLDTDGDVKDYEAATGETVPHDADGITLPQALAPTLEEGEILAVHACFVEDREGATASVSFVTRDGLLETKTIEDLALFWMKNRG